MNNFIQMIAQSGNFPKALFLMLAGILFVFIVQIVFYAVIKLWPKGKAEAQA
ncbi:MAG: hypothetical protein LBM77_03505 [Spirochaetaceae bacterium]|jgi:hypothetical protein|nr:hypothetical protein [Spirochaetaceae bacterium]